MWCILTSLLLGICVVGCGSMHHVDFVYFNLSGKEIRVVDIIGMPPEIAPGVLVPSHGENNKLEEKSASMFEVIHVPETITIVWQEGGKRRELALTRRAIGLPAKLSAGKVRFTYLGDGRWRVSLL